MKYNIHLTHWIQMHLKDSTLQVLKDNSYNKIIYFGQHEYEHGVDNFSNRLFKIANEKNVELDIVTASTLKNPNLYRKKIKYHFWETFWIFNYAHILKNLKYVQENYDYKKLFINLNHNKHLHRCRIFDLIHKFNLDKIAHLSFHKNHERYVWRYIFNNGFVPYSTIKDNFDKTKNWQMPCIEYNESFIDLVSESISDPWLFLSEKTARPLLLGKPFLVVSTKGFHKFLESLGFVLYNEIFDYSFDIIDDEEERFNLLLQNLDRLKSIPICEYDDIFKSIESKIKYNQQLAYDYAFNQDRLPKIIKETFPNKSNLEILEYLNTITRTGYDIVESNSNV